MGMSRSPARVAGGHHDKSAAGRSAHRRVQFHHRVKRAVSYPVGIERVRRRELRWPVVVDPSRDHPRKVETKRHRYDVRAARHRPVNTVDDHLGIATAAVTENLTYSRVLDPARDADADSVHVPSHDGAGAVSATALAIAVALAAEVPPPAPPPLQHRMGATHSST